LGLSTLRLSSVTVDMGVVTPDATRRGETTFQRLTDLATKGYQSPLALAYAIGPVAFTLIWGLRAAGVIADLPLWVYAAVWIGPSGLGVLCNAVYKRHPTKWALHLRAANDALATTLIIYATGWGPAIAVVYLVAAQQLVAATGPETWRVTRLWAFLGIAAGQLGIALGWVPSFIKSPMDDGVAGMSALAFVLVSRMAEAISADRERAWREVQANEERFRALVQSSSDLILVLDREGTAVYVSGTSERMLGLTAAEVCAAALVDLVHPDDLQRVRAFFASAPTSGEPTQSVELRARHADGRWRHLEAIGTDHRADPAIAGLVLNVRDVTERKRAEETLAYQALHDSLTGLPNRALLLQRLSASAAAAEAGGPLPAVLFVDVDRFKLINDSLGHDVGDQLLVEAAGRLRAAVRASDTIARFGGDEFVVLCHPPTDPVGLAERLLSSFEEPFRLCGESYYLSASLGVATPQGAFVNPIELLRDADTAMYRAKDAGRGRIRIFDEAARISALARAHTEHELRGAIDRRELRLVYQPIIDLLTGEVVATEALLRWEHPEPGLIGPGDFIDTAEESGLIVPIGEWVLREAYTQAALWVAEGADVRMSVNVSARQLADAGLLDVVREILSSGSSPLCRPKLILEVTESALIRDPAIASNDLDELKALGIELAMDDFGTGYSSLANLRRYPFDSIKIDRRFVSGITSSSEDLTIVRAVIDLAHGLGRTVIAEGVETAEQLDALQLLGCDLAQGYFLGRPSPPPSHPDRLALRERQLLS
jgi:diguanylate cyclase (GGDEF)-like protein/PAS domain S-box-containing protein